MTIDPATRFVRSLPGDYFMLREAAELAGVSAYTLRKYIAQNTEGLTPSKYVNYGAMKIYLYTREDIERLSAHVEERRQVYDHDGVQPKRQGGRPARYTKEERAQRNRLHSMRWYYRRRAEVLSARGDTSGAEEARSKALEIDNELEEMERE